MKKSEHPAKLAKYHIANIIWTALADGYEPPENCKYSNEKINKIIKWMMKIGNRLYRESV